MEYLPFFFSFFACCGLLSLLFSSLGCCGLLGAGASALIAGDSSASPVFGIGTCFTVKLQELPLDHQIKSCANYYVGRD